MPAATRVHYEAEHLMIEIVPDKRILSSTTRGSPSPRWP